MDFKFVIFIAKFIGNMLLGSNLNLVIIIAKAVALSQLINFDIPLNINQIFESIFKKNNKFCSSYINIMIKITIIFKYIFDHYTKSNIPKVKLRAKLWPNNTLTI